LQAADERQLWHAEYLPIIFLRRGCGDQHPNRRSTGISEHVENGFTDTGHVDRQCGTGEFAEEPADMSDDCRISRSERQPLKMADLIKRAPVDRFGHGLSHMANRSKSSANASSISSDAKTLVSASMNSPSNSCANSMGPSL